MANTSARTKRIALIVLSAAIGLFQSQLLQADARVFANNYGIGASNSNAPANGFGLASTDLSTPAADIDPVKQDRFVFGGQPLIPICRVSARGCPTAPGETMPAWAIQGGSYYFRLQVDTSFARFFWSPDHRTWRAELKNGTTLEFGRPLTTTGDGRETQDTGALDVNLGNRPNPACKWICPLPGLGVCHFEPIGCSALFDAPIFRWNIVRRYETNDAASVPKNLVVYRWDHLSRAPNTLGIGYLTDIYDTSPAVGAVLNAYAHHTHLE